MDAKPSVVLLMRKKNVRNFSIERLFESLVPYMSQEFDVEIVRVPSYGTNPIGLLRNILFTARLRADVIHVTGDVQYCALGIARRRCILTVHDLASLNRLIGIKRRILSLLWYRLPLQWASSVTVISEKVREEVQTLYPFATKKMAVVPNCVDPEFSDAPKELENGIKNLVMYQLLQVGTGSNKNLEMTARAVVGLPIHLRIVGTLDVNQRDLLESLGLSWSSVHGLSTKELIREYQQSDALVYISTYEGFGLPILEAQAVGIPVITSAIEPMRTVGGNATLLVDPKDLQDIRRCIVQLLRGSTPIEELVTLGRINVADYFAGNVASKYSKLYSIHIENSSPRRQRPLF